MANPNRNELLVTVGGVDILLRPTFENISSMESVMGGVAYLNWKFSKGMAGITKEDSAQDRVRKFDPKSMPSMTELAQVIFFNQVATNEDDPTKKKYSLEQIWDLVLKEGISVMPKITMFIAMMTMGDKLAVKADEVSPSEKKS